MSRSDSITDQTMDRAGQAASEASPWIERLGRLGFFSIGSVYALIGVLAARAAIGAGGATTDPQGALAKIYQAPLGRGLLAVITLGLLGYALWRFLQAGLDTEGKGKDAKGILSRCVYVIIGLIHVGLAISAVRLLLRSGGGGNSARDWTASLLSKPFGQWLVGIAGAVVIGVGISQLHKAYSAKFREKLKLSQMSQAQQTWATRIGRFGFAARGVVFCIIGGFLIAAAVQSQSREARGLGGALATLSQQPYGRWLLGVVSVGLISYGIFMAIQGRYRRMVIA